MCWRVGMAVWSRSDAVSRNPDCPDQNRVGAADAARTAVTCSRGWLSYRSGRTEWKPRTGADQVVV